MKRENLLLTLILIFALALAGCGTEEPETTGASGSIRMVQSIQVAIHPEDPAFDRSYTTQENMNELLTILRVMSTDNTPESEPDLEGGQSYYTVTITYSGGETREYVLLGHSYLRLGSDPWCQVEPEMAMRFNEFLRAHPSDDGSAPAETTVPPASE